MESAVDPTPGKGSRDAVILVVDDEPAIRRFVVRALSNDDVTVVEASDGEGALVAFEAGPDRFAAVFCDLSLHGAIEGEDVVRAIRAARPSIPIVVMTGWDAATVADQIGPVGPVELLQKPFQIAEIGAAFQRVRGGV